jgi:hypothetical protein
MISNWPNLQGMCHATENVHLGRVFSKGGNISRYVLRHFCSPRVIVCVS